MEESDIKSKQETIVRIDAETPSPDERARFVYERLQRLAPDLTDWDLVCFSANYLGWMSSSWNWLELPSKHICKLVYTAHYLITERTGVTSGIKRDVVSNEDGRTSSSTRRTESNPSRTSSGFDVSGGGFA